MCFSYCKVGIILQFGKPLFGGLSEGYCSEFPLSFLMSCSLSNVRTGWDWKKRETWVWAVPVLTVPHPPPCSELCLPHRDVPPKSVCVAAWAGSRKNGRITEWNRTQNGLHFHIRECGWKSLEGMQIPGHSHNSFLSNDFSPWRLVSAHTLSAVRLFVAP